MVPASFYTYFATSAGAGAALIGLLFVAISIVPENIIKEEASLERRVVANNTFTAMLNAFFISIGALIPGVSLGAVVLIFGVVGLSNSFAMDWQLFKERSTWQNIQWRTLAGKVLNALVGFGLYGYECFVAVQLIRSPGASAFVGDTASILLGIYAWGIVRAWELLGLRRFGLLNVLLDWLHLSSSNDTLRLTVHADQNETTQPIANMHEPQEDVSQRVDSRQG